MHSSDRSALTQHNAVWMTAIGRLKPGATARQARDELQCDHARLPDRAGRRPRVALGRQRRHVGARAAAGDAAGHRLHRACSASLTGLVLLIACSNVAGILLARAHRAAARDRDAPRARRDAGADPEAAADRRTDPRARRRRRQHSARRSRSSRCSRRIQPSLPVPIPLELQVDPRVMAFAMLLSACLGRSSSRSCPACARRACQLAPALHGAHATADRSARWLRQGLVAGQVAMALLLLVAAGLFLRSLQQAASIDAGFNVRDVDTLQIDTRIGGYRTDAEGLRAVDALIERFRARAGRHRRRRVAHGAAAGRRHGPRHAARARPRRAERQRRHRRRLGRRVARLLLDAAAAHRRGPRLHRPGSRQRAARRDRQRTVRRRRLAGTGSDRQAAEARGGPTTDGCSRSSAWRGTRSTAPINESPRNFYLRAAGAAVHGRKSRSTSGRRRAGVADQRPAAGRDRASTRCCRSIHTQTMEAATTLEPAAADDRGVGRGLGRHARPAARRVRALRPDGVLGGAADARDRDPHRARSRHAKVCCGWSCARPDAWRSIGAARRHRRSPSAAACCSRAC